MFAMVVLFGLTGLPLGVSSVPQQMLTPVLGVRCSVQLSDLAPAVRLRALPAFSETNPNRLESGLEAIPTRRLQPALTAIWTAFDLFSDLTASSGGPHLSQTHSFRDESEHALNLVWYHLSPLIKKYIALQVFQLHRIDDYSDLISLTRTRELDFSSQGDVSIFVENALLQIDSSGDLLRVYLQILDQMIGELRFLTTRHIELFNFGIKRMLQAGPIFSSPPSQTRAELLRVRAELLSRLPPNSGLREVLPKLALWFVGESIKPSFEMIEAISEFTPSLERATWANLFYGPMVHVHNNETETFGTSATALKTKLSGLRLVAQGIKSLPAQHRMRVLRPLPVGLVQSRRVLERGGLLDFYSNFSKDQAIAPYLPRIRLTP